MEGDLVSISNNQPQKELFEKSKVELIKKEGKTSMKHYSRRKKTMRKCVLIGFVISIIILIIFFIIFFKYFYSSKCKFLQ